MKTRVTHFMRRPASHLYSIENVYDVVRAHLPPDIEVQVYYCRYGAQGFWGRLYEILRIPFFKTVVNHVTGDFHYLTYLLPKSRTVLTIHDTVTLDYRSGLKRWLIKVLWFYIPEKRSEIIVCVSEFMKHRLLHYLKCNPNKIRVVYNPVSDLFSFKELIKKDQPRILIVGTAFNKNVERSLAALEGIACKVSIIGVLSESQQDALKKFNISYENHERLSLSQVAREYELSDLVVFASTYEGFGLPIIEAQAVGRPVITSNIGPMPEVAGAGACLVDPLDVDSIREGVLKVLRDDLYREALVKAGLENVKRFAPQVVANAYATIYREIAQAVTSS